MASATTSPPRGRAKRWTLVVNIVTPPPESESVLVFGPVEGRMETMLGSEDEDADGCSGERGCFYLLNRQRLLGRYQLFIDAARLLWYKDQGMRWVQVLS